MATKMIDLVTKFFSLVPSLLLDEKVSHKELYGNRESMIDISRAVQRSFSSSINVCSIANH